MTALAATALLATAVGTAHAGRFSLSERTFRWVWAPVTFTAGANAGECDITLEGSFHSRTIAKVVDALLGNVTRVRVARPCTNGTVWAYNGTETNEVLGGTLANSLPWHVTYKAFAGTLPNITQMRLLLVGVRFLVRSGILLCIYREGGEGIDVLINMAIGRVASVTAEPAPVLRTESPFCPAEGRLSGNGTYTVLGSTTGITVTLI